MNAAPLIFIACLSQTSGPSTNTRGGMPPEALMEKKMDDLDLSLKFQRLRKESEVNMPDDVENSLIMFLAKKAKEWMDSKEYKQ